MNQKSINYFRAKQSCLRLPSSHVPQDRFSYAKKYQQYRHYKLKLCLASSGESMPSLIAIAIIDLMKTVWVSATYVTALSAVSFLIQPMTPFSCTAPAGFLFWSY